jgi:hypothetical protein
VGNPKTHPDHDQYKEYCTWVGVQLSSDFQLNSSIGAAFGGAAHTNSNQLKSKLMREDGNFVRRHRQIRGVLQLSDVGYVFPSALFMIIEFCVSLRPTKTRVFFSKLTSERGMRR